MAVTSIHTRIFILFFCIAVVARPAAASSFPLMVKGATLRIGTETDRAFIASSLKGIFKEEEPSVSIPARIQYDFQAVAGEAPVTLVFDFNKNGNWSTILIDANMREQNPVGQQLVTWLVRNAGQGRKTGRTTVWKHGNLVFRLKEVKNAGEDSVYSVTISKKQ